MVTRTTEGLPSGEIGEIVPSMNHQHDDLDVQQLYRSENDSTQKQEHPADSVEQAVRVPLPESPVVREETTPRVRTITRNNTGSDFRRMLRTESSYRSQGSASDAISQLPPLERSQTEPLPDKDTSLMGVERISTRERVLQSENPYENLSKELHSLLDTPPGKAAQRNFTEYLIEHRNKSAWEFASRFDETLTTRSVLRMAELNRDTLRASGLAHEQAFEQATTKINELIKMLGGHYKNFHDVASHTMEYSMQLGGFAERRIHFDSSGRNFIGHVENGNNYGITANPSGNAALAELGFGYSLPSAPQRPEYSYTSDAAYFSRTISTTTDSVEFRNQAEEIVKNAREHTFSGPFIPLDSSLKINEVASGFNEAETRHLTKILSSWERIDNMGPEAFHHAIEKFGRENPPDMARMREEVRDLLQDQITLGNFIITALKERTKGKQAERADETRWAAIPALKERRPITDDVSEHLNTTVKRAEKYVGEMKMVFDEILQELGPQHDIWAKHINSLVDDMFSTAIKDKYKADTSRPAINTERKFLADRGVRSAIKSQYANWLAGGFVYSVALGVVGGVIGSQINSSKKS